MKIKKLKKTIKMILSLSKYYYYYLYCLIFKVKNKDIWLIAERGIDARDNSYHLFKYIRENHENINIKYVITKESADYKKVKKLGNVVEYNSKEHYILFITAGILISTHDMGYSPEMSLYTRLNKKGLLHIKGKKIYIKHGISKDVINLPNCDLAITGSYPEYKEIIKNYPNKNIKYTGLARFDNLDLNVKNSRKILFMPTFRKWLVYISDEEFKNSKYYKEIQKVLNSDKVQKTLSKNNYQLIFYPHIEIQNRLKLFSSKHDNIIIADFNHYDVQGLLKECDLLITDFSSVFFDFAYMRKPMIFYQFDIDEYRKNHYKEGYFSYVDDGFGKVICNIDGLESEIDRLISNNCIMDKKYLKRIDKNYKYNDKNNCKRIFEEINKIV